MQYANGYHPTQDQLSLAAEITASIDRLLPLSRLHVSPNESRETWVALDELGLFEMTLSEDLGGSGLGTTEEALILMGLGRRLIAPAVVASLGALHAPEFQNAPFDAQNARVAGGYRRDDRIVKIEEPGSQFLLLRQEESAVLMESRYASRCLDDQLWMAPLHEVDVVGRSIADFRGQELLRLRVLDAAVLVGISEAALEMAVAYAAVRQQFGRPIGSFQAVQHHCANMAVAARRARDQTSFAAVALDMRRDDANLQVECALLTAGSAALETAGLNIQIHGGIGFSDEADPHLVLKRAQLFIAMGGGLEAAAERIASIAPMQ